MMNDSDEIREFIYQNLGPQQALSLSWLILLTIVYVVILVSGLVGNFATILTITNLYLCNLAITDLISLMLSLPLELYSLWHQYPWQLGGTMCHLKTLILEGTANASVLTLVACTLERSLAICGSSKSIPPSTQNLFNNKSVSQVKRIACRNIVIIWTISLCGAAPLVLFTRINYIEYKQVQLQESAWCGLPYTEPDKSWELVLLSSTVLFFLIPLMIISFLYYQIARKLKKATRLDLYNQSDIQLTDHATSRKIIQSRKIVIRMLVVIVIVFTICWSPFHAQRLLFLYVTLYSSWNIILRQVNGILFLSAGCLYYLNSSLNPLIYSLLSPRFRAAFMLYVNSCCGKWTNTGGNQSTSGPRSRNQQPGGGKSNSNNSVVVVNGGNHYHHHHGIKNAPCLNAVPDGKPPLGTVGKMQWSSHFQVNTSSHQGSPSNSPSCTHNGLHSHHLAASHHGHSHSHNFTHHASPRTNQNSW